MYDAVMRRLFGWLMYFFKTLVLEPVVVVSVVVLFSGDDVSRRVTGTALAVAVLLQGWQILRWFGHMRARTHLGRILQPGYAAMLARNLDEAERSFVAALGARTRFRGHVRYS